MLKLLFTAFITLIIATGLARGMYPVDAVADVAGVDPAINELLERFNNTKAVGVFTKLSIKNNITRLNQSFGQYHQGKRPPTIEELRESYDLMVQEIMVLIQNKDPQLAKDLYGVRLLLWSYLAEPDKYALFQKI